MHKLWNIHLKKKRKTYVIKQSKHFTAHSIIFEWFREISLRSESEAFYYRTWTSESLSDSALELSFCFHSTDFCERWELPWQSWLFGLLADSRGKISSNMNMSITWDYILLQYLSLIWLHVSFYTLYSLSNVYTRATSDPPPAKQNGIISLL